MDVKHDMSIIREIREALDPRASVTSRERATIQKVLHANPMFGGNKKVFEAKDAITPLSIALQSVGFTLDMVPGDVLMGPAGTRHLTYRRTHTEAFYEHPTIENSRINLTWEDLGGGDPNIPSVEIIAYVT